MHFHKEKLSSKLNTFNRKLIALPRELMYYRCQDSNIMEKTFFKDLNSEDYFLLITRKQLEKEHFNA